MVILQYLLLESHAAHSELRKKPISTFIRFFKKEQEVVFIQYD